jgi:hypothetical protein
MKPRSRQIFKVRPTEAINHITAQLIRSAKSGSDWTDHELFAFNIVIQDVDVATFFGASQLPPTTVSPIILNNVLGPAPPAVISKEDRLFFKYLERANIGDKVPVDDFAGHILRMLSFDDDERSIVTKSKLSFTMCGTRVRAKADIAVLDDAEYSLMVQTDKVSRHWIFLGHVLDESPAYHSDRRTKTTTDRWSNCRIRRKQSSSCAPSAQANIPCHYHGWTMHNLLQDPGHTSLG